MRRRSSHELFAGEHVASPRASLSRSLGDIPSAMYDDELDSHVIPARGADAAMLPAIVIEPEESDEATNEGTPETHAPRARQSFMVPPAITAPRLQAFDSTYMHDSCLSAVFRRKDSVRRDSQFRDLTASPLLDVQQGHSRSAPPVRRMLHPAHRNA